MPAFQAIAFAAVVVFYPGAEALPEVELSRPGCHDGNTECPWWVYGNTYGTPRLRTMGLVFRTSSFGPISSRMHCFHAGCNGATSMFPDASDNFNLTGDTYCAAGYYGGLSPEQICAQAAPGAYVFRTTDFPFAGGTYLAAGFKTGGDRTRDAGLHVHDIHFIYERLPPPESPYSFGADTNLNPLAFPRDEAQGFDFYAGRLGKDAFKCRIADKNGWDILHLPDHVAVPGDEKCQFQYEAVEDMIAKLGEESARQRTYGYWYLSGPKYHKKLARQWGLRQARFLFQQTRTYGRWIDGRTLFADIERPISDPTSETWETCADPNGTVTDPEACDRNRAVLEGFLGLVAGLKFEPGVYTRPEIWVSFFGADFIPEVTIRRQRPVPLQEPGPQKQPFVLWISGCASTEGLYTPAEAEEIQNRDLMPIVNRATLGGSRAAIWQYHLEKPDFDTTLQAPDAFAPLTSSLAYNCTCSDPALWRLGFVGSCPPLDNLAVETLTIPSDGSTVRTAGTYSSNSAYRIEVSGTYRWGICDSFYCPGGSACNYQRWGDAEYLTDDCWNSDYEDFFGVDISVVVDGEHVDWGPFSSDHVYSMEVNGRNAPFSFQIADCSSCYGDNAGTLTVTIYEVSR